MSKQKVPLTRAQKQLVVSALMNSAGTIAEFWDETHPELEKVPAKEGIAYLRSLMRRMPGNAWDERLGEEHEA